LKWLIKLLATSLISAGIKSIHIDEIDINYNKNTIQNTYYILSGGLNDDIDSIIESINTTTNIKIDITNMTYELK
jgi:methionine synthase II (cobalamin-independent)